jgi:type II secretory ATPase GspE/PulE/Tfp pilus assembly ATPase PilB-like protein
MLLSPVLAAVEAGSYLNAWKAIPLIVLLLAWGRLITWCDKDAVAMNLARLPLNLINMGTGVLGFFLFFMLPGFPLATVALFVCILIGGGTYFGLRAQKVGLGDLTGKFTDWIHSFTSKDKKVKEVADELMLADKNGNLTPVPADDSPDRPGYDALQRLLVPALRKNAERVDVTPAEGGARVIYTVDGVPYSGGTATKEIATSFIGFLKKCAGLAQEEKRKPQTGKLKTVFNGRKRELQITSAGSSAGESLTMLADVKGRHSLKLDALGLLPEQLDVVRESIKEGGIVLVAAPKNQGLTSIIYAILRAHDAFLTHIVTLERDPDQDLEGITQNKLPANASPAEEYKQASWVLSQEPDVVAITSVEEPATAKEIIKFAEGGKRVYVGVRAGDAVGAIHQWRKWVGDDDAALHDLKMVVAGRVGRKLCSACKVAFAPDPNQLRKMNMDPEKVTQLFQARTEPMRDPKGNPIPCDFCSDLHFKGRTGIYEVLIIDDETRAAIKAGGSSKQLQAIFRKQKLPTLQEAALARVESGDTSVQEVLRVLKTEEAPRR